MPPSEFFIRLQRGIAGGFAPPTPSAVHTITTSPEQGGLLTVENLVRADGTPELVAGAPKKISAAPCSALIDELEGILKVLPKEYPPGSQDIYGEDTSIAWGSQDLEWWNGGPQGCGGGYSEVQASDEDKQKFKRAIAIVEELSSRHS
ncbi:hypothetical protein SISSUDRAFT_980348 [Sistotremastrum suecicum HHB10207 ss-3]|uniref:Uncharacterized protein n=1 Tax=Sistotremastrum suecicum HHB10207 ss-3 TaxID=1314776 RepID=A0A166H658_9AGAM|nr:hypothetical protein SISSUDRAFT_980348 [Sistotremastrum suecicum HHB10207 ss-3]